MKFLKYNCVSVGYKKKINNLSNFHDAALEKASKKICSFKNVFCFNF